MSTNNADQPIGAFTDDGRWIEFGFSPIPVATLRVEIEGLADPREARALSYACRKMCEQEIAAGNALPAHLFRGLGHALDQWTHRTEAEHRRATRHFAATLDRLEIPRPEQDDTDNTDE